MTHDKRPVILLAYSDPVRGADLARQVEDYFYGHYRVQGVFTYDDAVHASAELREAPELAAVLADERIADGGHTFLQESATALPDVGRLSLVPGTQAGPDAGRAPGDEGGVRRVTVPADAEGALDEPLELALERTLYERVLPDQATVVVHGHRKQREVFVVERFLRLNGVAYAHDEKDPPSGKKVLVTVQKPKENPVSLADPSLIGLAHELGLVLEATPDSKSGEYVCDVAVVGGGPAGISAAVNLKALYGQTPLIVEEFAPGGEAATAINRITNYLGFPDGIEAAELANLWHRHADTYGIAWIPGHRVTDAAKEASGDHPFTLTATPSTGDRDNTQADVGTPKKVRARSVVLAFGLNIRRHEGKDAATYAGVGLYYSALPGDADLYRDTKDRVAIIGGGDTAALAAIMFAEAGIRTILIVRGALKDDMLEASASRIKALSDFVEVREGTVVREFIGETDTTTKLPKLTKVLVGPADKQKPATDTLPVAAAYALIGAEGFDETTKAWLTALKVNILKNGLETVPPADQHASFNMTHADGVFVAGDARAGTVRRIAEAVGDGGSAALGIYNHDHPRPVKK
ncbi:NAD(P)/FAD-dependent oxidoreductase [Kitasatospora sp. NPDC015120]|uniref:NAD(P)/FAD-dependent oxidoreductase n=1 Tax=Kitasatospora sp. NPDC015120 TaxID=3364023 RepID=UPI0036F48E8C